MPPKLTELVRRVAPHLDPPAPRWRARNWVVHAPLLPGIGRRASPPAKDCAYRHPTAHRATGARAVVLLLLAVGHPLINPLPPLWHPVLTRHRITAVSRRTPGRRVDWQPGPLLAEPAYAPPRAARATGHAGLRPSI